MNGLTRLLCTLSLVGIVACDREGASGATEERLDLRVSIDSAESGGLFLTLHGMQREELGALKGRSSTDALRRTMMVSTTGRDSLPMLGTYTVEGSRVTFRPAFGFEAGRSYTVRVRLGDPSAPGRIADTTIMPVASRGGRGRTSVSRLLPSGDTVPENLLRVYVEFSAPMSRVGGLPYLTLLDERNQVVRDAFLPLDTDFWSRDRTRYTVFLDPGRVKQGIRPNEEMGRALRAGRRYTIVVDSLWPDEHGQPLASSFSKTFHVGAPVERAIDTGAWRYEVPRAGTGDPLVVTFATPLDHSLTGRSLGVQTADGEGVTGESSVGPGERSWRFVPAARWRSGDYRLLVLTVLEDVAGNRIDRPFEVDNFDRVDVSETADRRYVQFRIR